MLDFIIGLLIIIHGLIHLLYAGQSRRKFKLNPRMDWPDDSWVFSRFIDYYDIRNVATIACLIATVFFVISGLSYLFDAAWWRSTLIIAASFSSALFFLFWDGETRQIINQGGVDLLINIIILVILLK